jgi:hypothetical protein
MKSQEQVERLGAILAELQLLGLPAGTVGSSLLDILEILEGIRAKTRSAKARLAENPAALPGWSITSGRPRAAAVVPVRSYERENPLRLVRARDGRLSKAKEAGR